MYAPGGGAPAWKKPMGDRWNHTYMTWLTKTGTPPSSHIVLHTNRGQDIRAMSNGSGGGWDYYTPQVGFHVQHLRQRQASPNEFQMRLLTGETVVYDSAGRLSEIWDTLATPNKVLVTHDGAGQVSTVTDASTKRRLLFAYTSSQLTSVQFQVKISGTFTTYHTTSYGYTSSNLTSVTIGGQLAQTNVYTSNYLTQIQDGAGKSIVGFTYNATAGKAARIDSQSGTLGYDYTSSRASCSGKTVLYFNLGNTTSCDVDSDCGSGYLCGGKSGTGSTGRCFRGARCLTVGTQFEDVVTTVTSIGPPNEICEGACLDASEYVWNYTDGGGFDTLLEHIATKDPSGNYSATAFNANGLPTTISFGDPDNSATNGNSARVTFISYDTTFPGKVASIRRQSDIATASQCTSTGGACAVTTYRYTADGKVDDVVETGYTWTATNVETGYTYTTDYGYDTKGRLTQIDGPLTGANDLTQFTYHAATGGLNDDFMDELARKKDTANYVTQRATAYDFWGHPIALKDADNTFTCLEFDTARGYLEVRREAMNGQSDCSSINSADLETKWERDSALRLTKLVRPDGSCVFYEYDTKGRLERSKRRDDCNASSSGDKQEFIYDAEGLVTEIQTYDASNTLTAKQPFTYFDSRRLAKIVNPVDTSKSTGFTYDSRGLVQQIDGAGGFGKTVLNRAGLPGADGRVTSVEKYKTSSTFDTWNLLYAWLGQQTSVTDAASNVTATLRDDLGRVVRVSNPNMDAPRLQLYDAASRLTVVVDAYGNSAQRTHNLTYDNLGRPLETDLAVGASEGTCGGSPNPAEIQRVYDAPPVTCPIGGGTGCTKTEGRLAYEKVRLMCRSSLGGDFSLDQETFYAYDDGGRVVTEYIRDDASRVAQQQFTWTKNTDLATMTTPTSVALEWSHGSVGSNSDTDLVTAQSRNGTGNPVTSSVLWNPYGPLKQYNHQSTLSGVATRTRLTRNLAYRMTGLYDETQTGGTTLQSTVLAEDAKGRITARDYTPNTLGVQDSYFIYDDQDRVLCETTNSVGSCPTSGSNIKNSFISTPPFTSGGHWGQYRRPIPGSTGSLHYQSAGPDHRIWKVTQSDGIPKLSSTHYTYTARGSRSTEQNNWLSNDDRSHTFDQRNNKQQTTGWYRSGGTWYAYTAISAFDARNRRVHKSFTANSITSTWFFYYDPMDRLTEVVYTPNTASSTTYQVFQLLWLGNRLTAYFQLDVSPSTSTLSKRYVVTDETNRPIEMWNWPSSGDTTRVWAINPSAWGFDTNVIGVSYFQPVLFAGQYQDPETTAYLDDGTTIHRPGLVHNGFRTYDPFTGSYLQVDPLAPQTWSSYGYCDSDPVGRSDPLGLSGWDGSNWDASGDVITVEGGYWGVDPCGGRGYTGWDWDWDNGCAGGDEPPGGDDVPPGGGGGGGRGGITGKKSSTHWWEEYGEVPIRNSSTLCASLELELSRSRTQCNAAFSNHHLYPCYCILDGKEKVQPYTVTAAQCHSGGCETAPCRSVRHFENELSSTCAGFANEPPGL